MELRAALNARFDSTLATELAVPGTRAPPFRMLLPPALRETMLGVARLEEGSCPEALQHYYCERMPRMLTEQMLRGEDPARRLLWRPLELARLPRLREALHGLSRELHAAGLDAEAFLGASSAEQLVQQRPNIAALAAPALLGSGLPLVGAWPAERELMNAELSFRDPDEVLDLRLSGGLLHELCHGPRSELSQPPPPFILVESAALWLGSLAFPRHVFPEVPGEAVPGVSMFVLLGQALACLYGKPAVLQTLCEGPGFPSRALETAAWQDWLQRREVPFARDALAAPDWVKLAELDRAGLLPPIEDPLDAARRLPPLLQQAAQARFASLPWWGQEPQLLDLDLARASVPALFCANVLAPTYQTHPCEAPSLRLDVEACLLSRAPVPAGVFGEPARWLFPAPLCRKLRERGARTVAIEGAERRHALPIAEALIQLALGGDGPLNPTTVLRWTSSA